VAGVRRQRKCEVVELEDVEDRIMAVLDFRTTKSKAGAADIGRWVGSCYDEIQLLDLRSERPEQHDLQAWAMRTRETKAMSNISLGSCGAPVSGC
jgi:hypothetical protein